MSSDERWILPLSDAGDRAAEQEHGEHEVAITFVRDTLGMTVRHVARTGEPIVVRRYNRSDVVLVPLWEWRWLKAIEAAIRAGEIDASGFLRNLEDSGEACLDLRGSRVERVEFAWERGTVCVL